MKVNLPVQLDAGDLVINFLNEGGSYDDLINLILEIDAHIADCDFTTVLISKLAKSLSGEFTSDCKSYNQFIDSLKSE